MEQLPDKMMLSRNTVRAQSRNLLKKFEVDDLDGLRNYFEELLINPYGKRDDPDILVEEK